MDGVLTDGRIVYSNSGDELKFFDVTDGMGLSLWYRSGLKSAILTAKKSKIVARRSKVMHIDRVYQNAFRKGDVFKKILDDFKVTADAVCFIGDDVVDMPVLKRVGFAVSVPNAVPEAIPLSESPTSGSYTYPQMSQTYFFIIYLLVLCFSVQKKHFSLTS